MKRKMIIKINKKKKGTSFAECYCRYSDNALRKSLEVEKYTFVGNSSGETLNFLIASLYNLDAAIH